MEGNTKLALVNFAFLRMVNEIKIVATHARMIQAILGRQAYSSRCNLDSRIGRRQCCLILGP